MPEYTKSKGLSNREEEHYKHYKIRSFISFSSIIEVNDRIVENPQLLIDKPDEAGYLAVFQMNRMHGPGLVNDMLENLNTVGP